jgi:hypothetical protein
MVDMSDFYLSSAKPQYESIPSLFRGEKRPWVSDCNCNVCRQRKQSDTTETKSTFASYEELYRQDYDSLPNTHYFLMPAGMWGFVFKTRTWGMGSLTVVKSLLTIV